MEKGEFIAFSGTSGYSFGPHLHFEIRNAANQAPMNVLLFGFDIEDEVAPRVFSMYTYPVGNQSHVNGIPHKQRFPVVIDSGRIRVERLTRINGQRKDRLWD